MEVQIIAASNVIMIDGKGKKLNCESLRSKQIAFVNWYGERGEIKYASGALAPIAKIEAATGGWSLQQLIDMAKPFGKK